jgi:cell division septation protein DedD
MAQGSDLYKDRVEVSLDGRQIFYLFFGGAVVTCMVFVLGVVVGKKVEARSHVDRVHTTTSRDPLAALDRLENGDPLTFRNSLAQGQAATAPVEQEIAELERVRAEAAKSGHSDKPASDKPASDKPVDKNAKDKADKIAADEAAAEKAVADKNAKAKAEKALADKNAKSDKATADKAVVTDKPADKGANKFTLQLSSFQKRAEADAFADSVRDAGFAARVIEATVEGKGTFYRVRSGAYKTTEAADEAKALFERKMNKSAIIAKM